jgi:hypothetical protein
MSAGRCEMTFEAAMSFIKDHEDEYRKVRRPGWDRHLAVGIFSHYRCDATNDSPVRLPTMWDLDNGDGDTSGSYWIYKPMPADMEATDWEVYDARKLFPEEDDLDS